MADEAKLRDYLERAIAEAREAHQTIPAAPAAPPALAVPLTPAILGSW